MNRIATDTTPDSSITRHSYDEGGYLTKLEVQHRGSSTWTTVVHAVEHDAHGRRIRVERGDDGSGNAGLTTSYTYDPKSQRVTRIVTERSSDSAVLKDLRYHTDAVGLVTKVRDVSQQTHYYANAVVSADLDYHYDPLYRLVEASGRESTALGSTQHGATLPAMGPQPDASDPAAMRRYTQTYEYDPADNLIKLVHTPVGGTGWTRRYNRNREAAEVASPTLAQRAARESGSGRGAASWGRNYTTTGNRLQSTSISGDNPGATYTTPGTYTYSDHYEHDEHGSMTSMPHLPTMTWGHRDELTECTVGSETLHFQYAGGQRIRKHVIKTGSTTEERVYIGRYEKYTRRISGAEDMVRETLHLGDDLGRVAVVETKTVEGGAAVGSPTPMWRHPLGNMLGTAGGETTEDGSVIGYEEYHPYGTTAYRAKASGIDVSERRYRYTGMEQDEETGLGYHTARYYAGWLGRWVSADPLGLGGGGNRFGYADGRPTVLVDPGGMDPPRQNRPQPTNADLKAQNQAWIQEVEKERGGGASSAPDIGKGREGEASAASSSRSAPSMVTTTQSGPGIIVPGAQGGGGTNFLNDGTAETGAGAAPVAKKGVKTALDRVMSVMSILAMETANPEATLNTGGYPGGGGPEENAGAGMQTSIIATKVAEIGLGAVFGIVTKGTGAVGEVVEEGLENADSVVGKVVKGADEGGESAAKLGSKPALRLEYEQAIQELADRVPALRAQGMNPEQIARTLHAERRALGVKYKDLTPPEMLEKIYARNLEKYGDKLGPSIDYLRDQGKTWDQIIRSASRPGGKDLNF